MQTPVISLPHKPHILQNIKGPVGCDDGVRRIVIDSVRGGYTPDCLGVRFEKAITPEERKNHGQYYTPRHVVMHILSHLDIKKESVLLDPSCGCGAFLLTAYETLKEKYGKTFLNNVYGVDINADAADITRASLYMRADGDRQYLDVVARNIQVGNSIVGNTEIDRQALDWKEKFPHVLEGGGFDFIMGNPPYVTLQKKSEFDPSESLYPEIIEGPANAATLMIGKSLELLKYGGILAFLLPKTLLYVDSYNKLRSYLLQSTQVLNIIDLGVKFKDVRGEQVILIVKKQKPVKKQLIKMSKYSTCDNLFVQNQISISQTILQSTNRFLTFANQRYYTLIEKLSKIGQPLSTVADGNIFRGIPVSGAALCEDENGAMSAIRGKSIAKFKIKNILRLKNKTIEAQNANKIERLMARKVVLQNIFSSESGVIAAYDNMGLITLDTVTNIVVRDDSQGKYLLALLSSKLINFYLAYGLFNQSKLTMHLDRSYIGLIPVVVSPETKKKNRLIRVVDKLNIIDDNLDVKSENRKIDEIVYSLYAMDKCEIDMIEKAMAEMLSKKSIW